MKDMRDMKLDKVDELVQTMLAAATSDGAGNRPFAKTASPCNLQVAYFDTKLLAALTCVAHKSYTSDTGKFVYEKKTAARYPEGITTTYEGRVVRERRDVQFKVVVTVDPSFNNVEVTFDGDTKATKTPKLPGFDERVEFLFDYAVTDVIEWPDRLQEITDDEKRREDAECELE